ncbi:Rrf2 family transcriptional regulator [Lactococcus fujiensis]|uniref:Rrf2 family transcriptional regulator n=1 Tax=Lactococcus fujiensis JCM 16395 TaxID=1291764 RepID=A0A2A5RQ43_9LACT|nr:Rrf2 family transcriptional regulator [Lactococcus fujiensis]PCS01563.1 Rrf2 family transcriptional regulator [Lactococcus fujiensis JCM 16395]
MKNSYKTSDAIHILIYIELYKGEREMTSTAIAKSVSSNPGVIRRLMAQLSQAGLISTQVGKAVPALTRQASDISMLDVYKAVETECHLLQVDQKTNQDCELGRNIKNVLSDSYDQIQTAADAEMARISLADLILSVESEINKEKTIKK